MPLDKPQLVNDILSLFNDESDKDVDPTEARQRQAHRFANAIDAFVKSGDVNTTLTGTSATGGAITGTGKGKLT